MATTGAVLYVRPRAEATTAAGRVTRATVYVRPRTDATTIAGRVTRATVYVRPRAVATTGANRIGGASFVLTVRAVSGVFTSVGIDPERDLTNLRSFLPHSRQPLTNSDGTMNNAWYRF